MSQASVLEEAQDFLLELGDAEFLQMAFPDAARQMAMRCPVFSEVQMVSTFWVAGQWTEATHTFTDDTTDAQDVGTSDFALSSTMDNDGHMIGAYGKFEQVIYTIGTADDGTGIYEYRYWDGTFWQALPLLTTPNFAATGTHTLSFVAPEDWRQGAPTGITLPWADGFDANLFWIMVRATLGPGGLVGQDSMESAPQAMFLTIPPKGNTQGDMAQGAGIFRQPTSPPVIQSALATLLAVSTAIYPLPESVLALVTVLYYPNELEPAPVAEGLDLLQPTWRTATGTPTRYTQDLSPMPMVRLTPVPTAIGTLGIPIFTGTFGATVGNNNLVFFTLQVPLEQDMPPWFEALLSYAVASREARRLGEMHDLALAQALDGLVDGLTGMLMALWNDDGIEVVAPWISPLRR